MKAAILIPARQASTRYPGKPLAMLKGATGIAKPLIQRSWEAACAVGGIEQVAVVTDHPDIAAVAAGFGAAAVMTLVACENGTERCADALAGLDDDIDVIVNLQGDAPLTPPAAIEAMLAVMQDPSVPVATPAIRADPEVRRRLLDDQRAGRVGGTTVVTNATGDALYFSKSVIPHIPPDRAGDMAIPLLLHLGVYAYRRATLAAYRRLPPSRLERIEGLEQLRFLDAGMPVRVVTIDSDGADIWEVNNPDDIAPVERALAARGMA